MFNKKKQNALSLQKSSPSTDNELASAIEL
jgi:hypothetical protein